MRRSEGRPLIRTGNIASQPFFSVATDEPVVAGAVLTRQQVSVRKLEAIHAGGPLTDPIVPIAPDRLTFHAVDASRWADLARLFESRGGPKSCWCMLWRQTPEEAKHTDGASRRAAMAVRVAAGVPVGLLGYLDGDPVAWCSVAPRATYRRLVSDGSPNDGVWSIACMFVVRRLRGMRLAAVIIQAAISHARAQGASIVEAYPVDPDSHSYRFMGFVPVFQRAGFQEVGREGIRRHVMRLVLQ
jgi:GNAT superfamily N-acetyltransferase